jgi:hypothetical protein
LVRAPQLSFRCADLSFLIQPTLSLSAHTTSTLILLAVPNSSARRFPRAHQPPQAAASSERTRDRRYRCEDGGGPEELWWVSSSGFAASLRSKLAGLLVVSVREVMLTRDEIISREWHPGSQTLWFFPEVRASSLLPSIPISCISSC